MNEPRNSRKDYVKKLRACESRLRKLVKNYTLFLVYVNISIKLNEEDVWRNLLCHSSFITLWCGCFTAETLKTKSIKCGRNCDVKSACNPDVIRQGKSGLGKWGKYLDVICLYPYMVTIALKSNLL